MRSWTSLVTPAELAAALDDPKSARGVVVVDTRVVLGDPAAGAAAFRAGHVPGARHADLERDLSGPHFPGAGRHPWPSDEAFAAALGRLGIAPESQVVVYDDAGGALAASRLWFMLKAWGHECAAVLDGGWSAWQGAGLPVKSGSVPDAMGTCTGRFDRSRLLATEAIPAALEAGALLVDVRAPERFRGEVEPLDRKAGHIPGAVNRPFTLNVSDGRFRPPEELRAAFAELLGGRRPGEVIASCGSGVTACHLLLAMEVAGLPGARLSTGSWSGWIEDDTRPVAMG